MLNYPDLNLMYTACRKAQVDCLHVYLHRHPMEVLNSVVLRGYSANDTSSVQLTVHCQSPRRGESDATVRTPLKRWAVLDFSARIPPTSFGWTRRKICGDGRTNDTKYKEFMDSIYRKKPAAHSSKYTNDEQQIQQQWLVNSDHGPYVQSWWNAHLHAIQTCRQAVKT
jgi:hypothetical protein